MEKLALSIGGQPIGVPNGVPTEATTSLSDVLTLGFDVLTVGAVIFALIYLIWGGVDWIMSEGDKQKVNQARTKIGLAILGLTIVFLAFFIINIVVSFFLGDVKGGHRKRADIKKSVSANIASNWGIDKQKKTLYSYINI